MNFANILTQNVQSMVNIYKIRNARQKAVRSALMSAISVHPEYSGVGFDEQFMKNTAAELMDPFLAGGSLPTPDALLSAWTSQFPFSEESAKRAVANLAPLVTEFLYVLEQEVSSTDMVAKAASRPPIVEHPDSISIKPSYVSLS